MGVKSFVQEVKLKVSRSRLFKALVTESIDVLPKVSASIKSIEIVEGSGVAPGCVYKTNFPEGGYFTYMKNKIEAIDSNNCVCKFATIEGDALGEKLEKIVYELKIEEAGDGGCVVKIKSEYHSKGNNQISDEEIKAANEQAVALYKACEDYLIANPNACV